MIAASFHHEPDERPELEDSARFLLRAPQHALATTGCRERLPGGPAVTLEDRVKAFFAASPSGPSLLIGALPFDPWAEDALYQPRQSSRSAATGEMRFPDLIDDAAAEPPIDDYAAMVARCVAQLRSVEGGLRKVVLARSLRFRAAEMVEPLALAALLGRDPSVTTYAVPLPVSADEAPAWLVGASPELLVSRRGRTVVSHPLAGSARRCHDTTEDARVADALKGSTKDLDEHRYVVEAIVEALKPLCSELEAPALPSLHATETMWHLGTRIVGTLTEPAPSSAALAALLHPTPAVCGTPRQAAMEMIRTLEPVERGFYAGAVGWVDAQGDGDWYVAIRCAHVQDRDLRLFAGAGIVADSRPSLEVEETSAKFMALLQALGINETHTNGCERGPDD